MRWRKPPETERTGRWAETHLTELDTLTGNPADLSRVLWFLISLPFRLLVRVGSFLARRGR